jgi:hypothetical protein
MIMSIKPISQIAFEILLYLYYLEQVKCLNLGRLHLDFETHPSIKFEFSEDENNSEYKKQLMAFTNNRGDNLYRSLDYLINHGYIEPVVPTRHQFGILYFGFRITAFGYDIIESINDERGIEKIESVNHFHFQLMDKFSLSFPINVDLLSAIKSILGL